MNPGLGCRIGVLTGRVLAVVVVGAESESSPGCTVRGVYWAVVSMWISVLFPAIELHQPTRGCLLRFFLLGVGGRDSLDVKPTTERLLTGRRRRHPSSHQTPCQDLEVVVW